MCIVTVEEHGGKQDKIGGKIIVFPDGLFGKNWALSSLDLEQIDL